MSNWTSLSLLSIFLTLLSGGLSCAAAAKTLPLPKLGEDPVASIAKLVVELAEKHRNLVRLLIKKAEQDKTLGAALTTPEYIELINAEEVRSGDPQAPQQMEGKALSSLLQEISRRASANALLQLSAATALLAAAVQLLEKSL